MELGVDGVGRAFGGMRGGDPVGGLHVALVDQLARQHTALGPPRVGIDQCGAVARRLQHDCGGLGEFLLLAQIFGLGEEIAGRALARRAPPSSSLPAVLVAANDCRPGIGQLLGAGKPGHALRRFDALGIEHALHAEAVVGGGDDAAELLDDRRFVRGVQLFRAPERRQHGARRIGVAERPYARAQAAITPSASAAGCRRKPAMTVCGSGFSR